MQLLAWKQWATRRPALQPQWLAQLTQLPAQLALLLMHPPQWLALPMQLQALQALLLTPLLAPLHLLTEV